MPDYLRISDKQMFYSVPAAELPEPVENFILEPDLSAVDGYLNTEHWLISGTTISLKSKTARDAVDAVEKDAVNTAVIDAQMNEITQVLLEKINELQTAAAIRNTTLAEVKTEAKAKR